MINKKEIQNKINSVLNTRKITRAMEMISVIKMKKSKIKRNQVKPYFNTLQEIIFRLNNLCNNKNEKNEFFFKKNFNKIIFIIILSSKGLCGGLNANLFKYLFLYLKNFILKRFSFKFIIFGKKESIFINQFKKNIQEYNYNFYKNFNFNYIQKFSKKLFKRYQKKKIDKICIVYNKYFSKKSYVPVIEQLLPIKICNKKDIRIKHSWDYIYESNPSLLYKDIFNRFFTVKIYYSILENLINEHFSRMVAMKNATENSSNSIKNLQMTYNKDRKSVV